jgi:hypothetical protein
MMCSAHLFCASPKCGLAGARASSGRASGKAPLLIPLSSLELHRPQIYLYRERTSGLLNLDRLFPPDTSPSPPSQTPLTLRLPHLTIHEGAFTFRDSTAPDSVLLVRKGFMNYAHIQFAHLNLSATIEKHGNRLFAYIRHLSVTDTAAQVKVDTLKLALRAYPDSTVIDNLYLRTGASRLQAQGKLLYEGLDKLFLNTDTKQFEAWFKGAVDWRDIAAFSGASVPLRGLWHVETRMEGDLTRLRWKQLHIETAEGLNLETAGEIWHYARPRSLYWDVRVRQGVVSLGGLERPFQSSPAGQRTGIPCACGTSPAAVSAPWIATGSKSSFRRPKCSIQWKKQRRDGSGMEKPNSRAGL